MIKLFPEERTPRRIIQGVVPKAHLGAWYTNKPSINKVIKHAEFPQIYDIDKVVVDMPVVMQRQVPQIQTVSKTVENPTAQFIDRDEEAPLHSFRRKLLRWSSSLRVRRMRSQMKAPRRVRCSLLMKQRS